MKTVLSFPFEGLEKSRTHGARDKKKREKGQFFNRYSKLKGRMSEGRAFSETKMGKSDDLEKSRTPGATDKKKRKSKGKKQPWDYKEGHYPKEVMEATVHQAAKDWGVSKNKVRQLLKQKLAERKAKE
jgi:hypothetical protein